MIHYIYRDMVSMIRYLPYGLITGIPAAAILLYVMKKAGRSENKKPAALLPVVLFAFYFALMMVITFLSRESGCSRGGMDLKLFSTWGINKRNNAFVVENVLLFIPYGFLGCMAFGRIRRFFACLALGAATSLGIESLQLITGRGFFQIDDILTNILGTVIGFLIYRIFFHKFHKKD